MGARIEGGCHCGAVRYALSAPPTGSMICHCQTCRRTSGAPIVAWISMAQPHFTITKGEPARYVSSANVNRQFCAMCGAHLTYMRADEPGGIDITTATLDDPEAFPPTHHSWVSHNIAWVKFGDGLPAFQRNRDDG